MTFPDTAREILESEFSFSESGYGIEQLDDALNRLTTAHQVAVREIVIEELMKLLWSANRGHQIAVKVIHARIAELQASQSEKGEE